MGKRKTRKEKVNSDLRNQIARPSLESPTSNTFPKQIVYTVQPTITTHKNSYTISLNNDHHVYLELKKITFTITTLFTLQLILFALLKLKIVTIPFLNY